MHFRRAPDVMRAALAQIEQARAVIDLAVGQHDRADTGAAQHIGIIQFGRGQQLMANVRGNVAQYPVLPSSLTAMEDWVRRLALMLRSRTPRQLSQLQFHWESRRLLLSRELYLHV